MRRPTLARPLRRRAVVAVDDTDGTIRGADGIRRALLHIPGFALDAQAIPDRERHAGLFGSLAASLPRKARLVIFVENRPTDAAVVVADLRAQLAPVPHTPQLGELADRMLAWWERRLSASTDPMPADNTPARRHVARLDYWLLVDPYPAQDGYPDQSEPARLRQAVAALTRQLVAMGLPPTPADPATARAFVGRHLVAAPDAGGPDAVAAPGGIGYVAAEGDETFMGYRLPAGPSPVELARPTNDTGRPGGSGERWTRILFLVHPPAETDPGWLRALVATDSPATLVLHLRGLSPSWERRRQAWRLRVMEGTMARGKDITTRIAATEAEAQATALHRPGYGVVKVGAYLRLEGATKAQLDARVGFALRAMRDTMHAEPGFGHAHQKPLYLSTLPGYGDRARSTYRWDSITAGQACPFLAFNPGTRTMGVPLGTTEAAGDLVTLAFDDPGLYNRIGIILGRTGTGKTSLLQKTALFFLLRGHMATLVSAADSFSALCAIAGGQRVILGGPHSGTVNVWDGPRATDEDRAERVAFVSAALDLLLQDGLVGLEAPFLDDIVNTVYAEIGPERTPVMSDLAAHIEGRWTAPGCDPDDKKVWRGLGWKLRPYVGRGQYARLVDGQTTVRLDAPVLAFSTEPLTNKPRLRNFAYFATFAIVAQRRALARAHSRSRGRGTDDHLMGMDEAWDLLKSQLAREWIDKDARDARIGGSCVLFSSHQIKDATTNPEVETFFTQASFKALFSVEDNGMQTAGNPKLWTQRMLSLTEEEVAQAQGMAGEKDVYMPMFLSRRDRNHARDLHGIVRVELTPEEALLFASDPEQVQARDWWAAQRGGDVWEGIKLALDGEPMEATA